MKKTLLGIAGIVAGVTLAAGIGVAWAARGPTGTYTLPTSVNPVQPNTPIATNWANTTLSDVGTALTDSLSRSGKGGMNAPLKLTNGSAGAPALSWSSSPTTGFYRAGADNVCMSIANNSANECWSTSGQTITNSVGISGDLSAINGALSGTLEVAGNLTASASLAVSGDAGIGGNEAVAGNALLGSLNVTADAGVGGNESIGGALAVGGDAGVAGNALLGSLNVTADAGVGGNESITGNLNVGGLLHIASSGVAPAVAGDIVATANGSINTIFGTSSFRAIVPSCFTGQFAGTDTLPITIGPGYTWVTFLVDTTFGHAASSSYDGNVLTITNDSGGTSDTFYACIF